MLTVPGQQHSSRHMSGCSCESVKVFEIENVWTWEGLKPPIFGFMPNGLNIWAIRARHLLSQYLNTGSGGIDILLCKVNIWTVDCAWATAFIFDTRTDVLLKVSKFLRQKILYLDLRRLVGWLNGEQLLFIVSHIPYYHCYLFWPEHSYRLSQHCCSPFQSTSSRTLVLYDRLAPISFRPL